LKISQPKKKSIFQFSDGFDFVFDELEQASHLSLPLMESRRGNKYGTVEAA